MTTSPLSEHEIVMVRARIHTVFDRECMVLIPTLRGEELVMVPYDQIYRPPSSDAAAQASGMMVDYAHRMALIAERTHAEIAEWGAHALQTDPLGR